MERTFALLALFAVKSNRGTNRKGTQRETKEAAVLALLAVKSNRGINRKGRKGTQRKTKEAALLALLAVNQTVKQTAKYAKKDHTFGANNRALP